MAANWIAFSTTQGDNRILSISLNMRRSADEVSARHWRPKAAASATHSLFPIRKTRRKQMSPTSLS